MLLFRRFTEGFENMIISLKVSIRIVEKVNREHILTVNLANYVEKFVRSRVYNNNNDNHYCLVPDGANLRLGERPTRRAVQW